MTFAEASEIVEATAWRRFTCLYDGWRRDVYLLGSRDIDLTSMLILEYRSENNETTLVSTGAFETYMLNAVTSDCEITDLR
jgi:hypothetical protein